MSDYYAILILYALLFILGGAIGIARYSLEEEEDGTSNEHKESRKILAHFVLSATVAVIGGVITKYTISPNVEAVIAGGLIAALIGHARVRSLAYDLLIKRTGLNGKEK